MAHADAELIQCWQNGDAAAFEALVRQWQQPMARFLARMAGDGEHVHDLCQEVFLRMYRARGNYRHDGRFSTWLYRIALNVARDAGRRQTHRLELIDNHQPIDNQASAERRCEQRELAREVDRALGELPEPLREALVLRHYLGMNFAHMSELLETPASTLKSRFATALGRLRSRLARFGWNDEKTQGDSP